MAAVPVTAAAGVPAVLVVPAAGVPAAGAVPVVPTAAGVPGVPVVPASGVPTVSVLVPPKGGRSVRSVVSSVGKAVPWSGADVQALTSKTRITVPKNSER